MPTINKPTKKHYHKKEKAKLIYDNVYNTTEWRKLRKAYLMQHPLCEKCLENDVITVATQVHHVTPISTANSILGMKELGYCVTNLMALCDKCHQDIHNKR